VSDDVALSADERAELERLRAEVSDLRSQVSTVAALPTDQPVAPTPRPRRQRWRSVVATFLIVVGCILASPLSVVAVWTKNLVTDTDRYVATVAPLADDPAIQNAVADKITVQIFTHLDVAGVTNHASLTGTFCHAVAAARNSLPTRMVGGPSSDWTMARAYHMIIPRNNEMPSPWSRIRSVRVRQ
jgi:hypothetical protein